MNKVLYIIGIVSSVIFLVVTGYYIAEVESARSAYLYSLLTDTSGYGSSYTSIYDSLYDTLASDLTLEAGLISIFFFLYFIFADLMGLLKVKTKTMRVFAIIGLSISGLFLIWDLLMLSSPGAMSFDEVGVGFLLYCFIILAFSIVGLVQSARYKRGTNPVGNPSTDLLDS